MAVLARAGGAGLFSRPVLLVEVGAEVGDVSAVRPDTSALPLPQVRVAQGLEFRFDLALIVHILADPHILGGSFPLGRRLSVLPVLLKAPHEAPDYGKAGHPGCSLRTGHGACCWLWLVVGAEHAKGRR